jgi:hypothetical protein
MGPEIGTCIGIDASVVGMSSSKSMMKEQLYGMLESSVEASWRPLRQHITPSPIMYNFSLIN